MPAAKPADLKRAGKLRHEMWITARHALGGRQGAFTPDVNLIIDAAYPGIVQGVPTVFGLFGQDRRAVHARFAAAGLPAPKIVLDRLRAAFAIELLGDGLSQEQVSMQLGFGKPQTFRTWFERATGTPAREGAGLDGRAMLASAFTSSTTETPCTS